MKAQPAGTNPWLWIPTLYFGQGIPYVVVMTLSVIMYKNMGVSNTDIALYTSWLYLPWVIKPLWSPLIELFSTKRVWIVALQFAVGASLACVALTIPGPNYFSKKNGRNKRTFFEDMVAQGLAERDAAPEEQIDFS